jgi:hypothetical protein
VGHQDYFLVLLPGSIALFVSSLGIHIVRCNHFIMGKPRDGKVPLLPSTIKRGTTLNTSIALDSPSVMSKLLPPPHAPATATSSAELENATNNLDDASTVLDESGSLGSFLDATIARTKMENTTVTHVSSPESRECPSDDFNDAYIELVNDFIAEARATRDTNVVKELLARRAIRYKLSPDAKFAASPINIRDKDYDFSLDLSYISIVEKEPFCGTENESAIELMNELSTLSNLFSDDIKIYTYFVAKIFPFSLKDAAKTWFNNLSPGSIFFDKGDGPSLCINRCIRPSLLKNYLFTSLINHGSQRVKMCISHLNIQLFISAQSINK